MVRVGALNRLVGVQGRVVLLPKPDNGDAEVYVGFRVSGLHYLRELVTIDCLTIGDDQGEQGWPTGHRSLAELFQVRILGGLPCGHDPGPAAPADPAPFVTPVGGVEVAKLSVLVGEQVDQQPAPVLITSGLLGGCLGILSF
jgi:hypothetical protein